MLLSRGVNFLSNGARNGSGSLRYNFLCCFLSAQVPGLRAYTLVRGPRQVGKTTLALSLITGADESHPAYLNWDLYETQRMLLDGGLPADQSLIILDEIHKYRHWRNLVKGFYDKFKSTKRFMITGSARLDHYRRGGDSLQGRKRKRTGLCRD